MDAIPISLHLNLQTLQLGNADVRVDITAAECSLLHAFALASGQRLDTRQMLMLVGKCDDLSGKRALEVQIVRLRKKLEAAGATSPTIKSIRGRGYQLCVPLLILPSPV